jgi:hypothetical protein
MPEQNRLSMADRGDLPTVGYCAREGLRYLAYMPDADLSARNRHFVGLKASDS